MRREDACRDIRGEAVKAVIAVNVRPLMGIDVKKLAVILDGMVSVAVKIKEYVAIGERWEPGYGDANENGACQYLGETMAGFQHVGLTVLRSGTLKFPGFRTR